MVSGLEAASEIRAPSASWKPTQEVQMAMSQSESAVRARAQSHGYRVEKSRQRMIHINNHGEYRLIDPFQNLIVLGERYDASLGEIAEFLD
jgi:hypothetical protein